MILPLDLDGFVNLIPISLEYTGPTVLMQVFQINYLKSR